MKIQVGDRGCTLMLRAVSTICLESRAVELIVTRRDPLAGFRRSTHTSSPLAAAQRARKLRKYKTTVLSSEGREATGPPPSPPPPPPPPGPRPGPGPAPRRAWPAAAVALALTASLGGVYFYRKKTEPLEPPAPSPAAAAPAGGERREEAPPVPADGAAFPEHVEFLVAGAGTAAFAALRALRAARPAASVLLVGDERALPYMRPPLSKELWREPELAARAADPDRLTFRQWNGKRRPVVYEPAAFYTPVERLAGAEGGGAAVARGWRVARLDVERHEAELAAPGRPPVTVRYDRALVATGARPRRVPALREAAARGRSLALRSLADAARLAALLDDPATSTVAVVGGGFLATELSAALADRLRGAEAADGAAAAGRAVRVVQVVAERAPMAAVLPDYLAQDAARRLAAAGVTLLTNEEVVACSVEGAGGGGGRVSLQLSSGAALAADVVVEAVGAEPDAALPAASRLETHPELGGLLVNAELQARTDVWAAGDAACFYDEQLGRRRVEHHDHAVLSGRLAGTNMAATAAAPPRPYTHQSMFWSDLGPQLGYEAIGIIDSRLPTVGVFSADAVVEAGVTRAEPCEGPPAGAGAEALVPAEAPAAAGGAGAGAASKRYERGVVFYLRDERVVGVLLWNLFNRMHVARQVLAQGTFEDLLEVGKLFAPHEED